MSDPNLFRLRVVFCKQGRLALLSHLEVTRALERAVRRSGLPFAVSQGFSPHMRLAFGAALPVGVGGTNELFDLLLKTYVPPKEALAALQAASVPDLMVKSCFYIDHQATAASVAFPVSTYEGRLSFAPAVLPVPRQVHVVRKKGERTLEVEDFLAGGVKLSGERVEFTLEAKPTGSLRPDVFLRACCEAANGGPQGALGCGSCEGAAEVVDAAEGEPAAGKEPFLMLVKNEKALEFPSGEGAGCARTGLSVLSLMRIAQRESADEAAGAAVEEARA